MTTTERFWSKVAQTGNVCECWNWTGSLSHDGYGKLKSLGRYLYAHRVAFENTIGRIPIGFELDHLCRNRSCVNPWHLEPVTRSENCKRGTGGAGGRERQQTKTHCPSGHEYTPGNTYVSSTKYGGVMRSCKRCGRERALARYHRLRAN